MKTNATKEQLITFCINVLKRGLEGTTLEKYTEVIQIYYANI